MLNNNRQRKINRKSKFEETKMILKSFLKKIFDILSLNYINSKIEIMHEISETLQKLSFRS